MKKSLTEYVSALTGTDMEAFEDIIVTKYKKFLKFYEIIKEYSDNVTELEYEFSDDNTLSVNVSFDKDIKIDKDELISDMESSGYVVEKSKIKSKKIKLKITYDE